MGFVQSPHDYREWEDSLYLKMCYWEYKWFYHTSLVSQNERNSARTVGTMCLIRRTALEEAGGWAEWCATEDSELAIRIHALGYSSVYLNTTFGRGLIPETFDGFKRQRFRWTCGPVQELKHHWHLYLPWRLRRPSALSAFQRIHHLNHGLENLTPGLALLFTPLGVAVSASMMLHGELVHVPLILALTTLVILAAGFAHRWLVYRVIMGCSLKDVLGAFVAGSALNHTRVMMESHTSRNLLKPAVCQ
jgi:cellulose synthase/poly-beta-1,6-N-acetylglucosamine synthase-like glycosyltransferase